jgi:hypothetical protein
MNIGKVERFIHARVDEAERVAVAALNAGAEYGEVGRLWHGIGMPPRLDMTVQQGLHIARHDPERELRACRAITTAVEVLVRVGAKLELRDMAAIWSDHVEFAGAIS